MTDPPLHDRLIPSKSSHPMGSRYTLQWLIPGDEFCLRFIPNNSDTSLVTHKPKPAEILLALI